MVGNEILGLMGGLPFRNERNRTGSSSVIRFGFTKEMVRPQVSGQSALGIYSGREIEGGGGSTVGRDALFPVGSGLVN